MTAPELTNQPADTRFGALLQQSLQNGSLVRITLGAPLGTDRTLRNLLIRPVLLKQGPRLSFVWRHATQDITKNFAHDEGLRRILAALGTEFRTAYLNTTQFTAQLEYRAGRPPRLTLGKARQLQPVSLAHDRPKRHPLGLSHAPWLQDLGVTTADCKVVKGMEDKFRQIQKFVELLQHLIRDAIPSRPTPAQDTRTQAHRGIARATLRAAAPAASSGTSVPRSESVPAAAPTSLTLVDMGCGKGYLTFAAYEWLRRDAGITAEVLGLEGRPELVDVCNQAARKHNCEGLRFQVGRIADAALDHVDILMALHACDTATDDAIFRGIRAGAALIVVAPCCHKELRPQLRPPPMLREALRHGILLEREAEFVTDALRAGLLEWAGYDTRVFEFISTEHTSKNLMIAGIKRRAAASFDQGAQPVRDLAGFYGIHEQCLAKHLGFNLSAPRA
jgi:SAM-dependent methyltransferase